MDWHDIAAIVTGGGSGLGEAVARRLADGGARVTILDHDASRAALVSREIGGRHDGVDVTDAVAVKRALERAERANGPARLLVNCAGIGVPQKVLDHSRAALPPDHFIRLVQVNLIGTFAVIAQFAERIARVEPLGEERGVIVNTASVAAFDGQVGQAAYAASKAGVVGMTLPLAREFARIGVRVLTIAPGIFRTPMLAVLPPEAEKTLGAQVPFPSRLGEPHEFAHLVTAAVENPMLNGEVIRLDGAIRMAPR